MHFSDLLNWALSAAKAQAQKTAIQEIQKAANALNAAVGQHAGDVQHLVEEQLTKAAAAAVAGVLSKKG